ncbi:hypothetical protein [Embleya sp. AB8]|uniref:hypothetical protein n=1 Tax=Embleya sp. AB8 TaxID=3156304 RepID=UPI003C75B4BC
MRIRLRKSAEGAWLVPDAPGVPPALRRFLVERDAAAIPTVQRELFAEPTPFR